VSRDAAIEEQRAHKQGLVARARRAVVKIGSNVVAGSDGLREERLRALADEIATLVAAGRQVVVVTSGAVAAGAARLGRAGGGRGIEWRQAAAALGQIGLMAAYERAFAGHGRQVAQVLLTHADLANRRRYLNARHTLRALLDLGVVPIVNENDTVAVEELKFGDNDNLSALTASLVEADLLVILSDVAGLHTRDPRVDSAAPVVRVVRADDAAVLRAAGPSRTDVGTGGMASKLAAAAKAAPPRRHPDGHRRRRPRRRPRSGVRRRRRDRDAGPPRRRPPRTAQALDRLHAQARGHAPRRRGSGARARARRAEPPAVRRRQRRGRLRRRGLRPLRRPERPRVRARPRQLHGGRDGEDQGRPHS
jgi:uridylate kinase